MTGKPSGQDELDACVRRNEASRARIQRIADDAARGSAERRAAVGSVLVHLAFWDRYVLERWILARRLGRRFPDPIDVEHLTDLVNAASQPLWELIPFDAARLSALDAAAAVDWHVAQLDSGVVEELLAGGLERLADRSLHRLEHLDQLRSDDSPADLPAR